MNLIQLPRGRELSAAEAHTLQGPLSRQLDALLALAGSALAAGPAAAHLIPGLLQGVEITKQQLATLARTLADEGVPKQDADGTATNVASVAQGVGVTTRVTAAAGESEAPGLESRDSGATERSGSPTRVGDKDKGAQARRRGTGTGTTATTHKPAPGREGRWVDVMDSRHDGRRPVVDMARLDRGLHTLLQSLEPTPGELAAQEAAVAQVEALLKSIWPDSTVKLFGSAANGLSVRGTNDLDVCVQLPEEYDDPISKSEAAVGLAEQAQAAGMTDVVAHAGARIPVVKFSLPGTTLRVDVTINNTLACANTGFLATYAALDPRVAQLVRVIKHWAKRRCVNEPYTGTLSSYCYVLMCVHLLQTREPPVLPCLQSLPHAQGKQVQGWDVGYCNDLGALKGFGEANTQSLAELVWDFFEYWAWRHDYRGSVVSVRTGGLLSKSAKGWHQRVGRERHLVCIEDPFELSHDLGRTVDKQTSGVLRKEFLRAATLLRDSPAPLAQLFEQFRGKQQQS